MYTLLERTESPGLEARLFLSDDPALVVLYRQLREKTLQTLRGASKISPRVEWNFILHNARLYDRMGCDILALELGELSFGLMGCAFVIDTKNRQCVTGSSLDSRLRKLERLRCHLIRGLCCGGEVLLWWQIFLVRW